VEQHNRGTALEEVNRPETWHQEETCCGGNGSGALREIESVHEVRGKQCHRLGRRIRLLRTPCHTVYESECRLREPVLTQVRLSEQYKNQEIANLVEDARSSVSSSL